MLVRGFDDPEIVARRAGEFSAARPCFRLTSFHDTARTPAARRGAGGLRARGPPDELGLYRAGDCAGARHVRSRRCGGVASLQHPAAACGPHTPRLGFPAAALPSGAATRHAARGGRGSDLRGGARLRLRIPGHEERLVRGFAARRGLGVWTCRNARQGRRRLTGDCESRVLRGGSWFHIPQLLRSAHRNRHLPVSRFFSFGFRVARTPGG
jgi:hypothetical protein